MTTKQDEWRVESDHMIITLYQGCTEVIKDYPAYDKTEVFNRIAATMNVMERVKEVLKGQIQEFSSAGKYANDYCDEWERDLQTMLDELEAIGCKRKVIKPDETFELGLACRQSGVFNPKAIPKMVKLLERMDYSTISLLHFRGEIKSILNELGITKGDSNENRLA